MTVVRERGMWVCRLRVEDFAGEWSPGAEALRAVEAENLLMRGGASLLWSCVQGDGTATAGQALTYLNNTHSAIGAGSSSTAAAATQTNLQGASRLRKGMNSGYPDHTDGTGDGAQTIIFQSTFGTSEANFDWQEVGLFNSATDGSGRMVNRIVQAIGTKTTSISRVATMTINLV